ncbi:calnexin precursor [Pelomyxa schiedti]|nr:calnexin precursor [Pelomyxa schiedti]
MTVVVVNVVAQDDDDLEPNVIEDVIPDAEDLDDDFEEEETPFVTPIAGGLTEGVYFFDHFSDETFKNWVMPSSSKYTGEWAIEEAEIGITGDEGLVVKSVARHHGISVPLYKPVTLGDLKQPFIVQYEVKLQRALDCGGAYIKLLSSPEAGKLDLTALKDDTPYTIMFGPDKCGTDSKVHFIFRHQSPMTGEYSEKHLTSRPTVPSDGFSHLYTLKIFPENKFELSIDQQVKRKGSLFEEFEPPVVPPLEIDDPSDIKPADWVDTAKIPDPTDSKPDDWDETQPRTIPDPNAKKPIDWLDNEPEYVPDPAAEKPSDWDDDLDGEWTAALIQNPKCQELGCGEWAPPMIPNPDYKGKWSPKMIDNPDYKGPWAPRKIPNPNYFYDSTPLKSLAPIEAIAFELWTMTSDIYFDNLLITTSPSIADKIASEWSRRYEKEKKIKQLTDPEPEEPNIVWRYINHYLHDYIEFLQLLVKDYPIFVGFTAALGFVPIFWCCCCGKRESKPKEHHKKTDKPEEDDSKKTTTTTTTTTSAAKTSTKSTTTTHRKQPTASASNE